VRDRRDDSRPLAAARRAALVEVSLATAAIAVVIGAVELLGRVWPGLAGSGAAIVALGFLGLPLLIATIRRLDGDVHGIGDGGLRGPGSIGRGVVWGLAATLVIVPPFVVGYDVLRTQFHGAKRGGGPGLDDHPVAFSGTPRRAPGVVAVYSDGASLAVYNGRAEQVWVQPACVGNGCEARRLGPGSGTSIRAPASDSFRITTGADGAALQPGSIVTGAGLVPVESQPIEAPRSLAWLLWGILTQLLVVALPEETFFRGYVQGRLRAVFQPRHRVLGTPFGVAHVVAAALFALVHLVATPAPARLLVFFPGLLFAWLAERARSTAAPTVHHALSNLLLQTARRFYG